MDDTRTDDMMPVEPPVPPQREFQDLSLLELVSLLVIRPGDTWGALRDTLDAQNQIDAEIASQAALKAISRGAYVVDYTTRPTMPTLPVINWQAQRPLLMLGGATLIALIGSFIVETGRFAPSVQPLLIGGLLMILGAVAVAVIAARSIAIPRMPPLEEPRQPEASEAAATSNLVTPQTQSEVPDWLAANVLRIGLLIVAMIWTVGSWLFNTDNQFTAVGVFCWIMSIITLTASLVNQEVNWAEWLQSRISDIRTSIAGTFSFRLSWTAVVLAIILIVGAWYRFNNLSFYPPDMTSDHVEKILDSARVYDGARDIFFANNGGREPFQFYFLAVLKGISGLPWSFELLKLASGMEGMLMILMAWWMGRAIFGEENRQLGNLVGLLMAALIAVSFWHVLLSRLGLRIVTTPLVVTFVFIFLARGLRYNRRSDFLIAGFGLGAGMYFYQAIRMLPLVVITGVVLALILRARSRHAAREYIVNFIALTLLALAVFVPLGHYMVQNPGEFWNRTAGRLFGDANTQDSNGNMTPVPFDQRLASFGKNLPVLGDNMVKSVLMFNWKGDSSWFNGSPQQYPALDFATGAMFVFGLGLLVVRVVRRRDPVDVLLPLAVVIMVLPSALAIAFPIEVPGFTRGSGSLPIVYLIAAFGLAVLVQLAQTWATSPWIRRGVLAVVVVLLLMGGVSNANAYFGDTMADYRNSTLPHRQAGTILRGFINSTGAPGNAFMVAYKYWWDNRALGIEAGDIHWHNTLPNHDELQQGIIGLIQANALPDLDGKTPYALQPDRQLMFFLDQEDKDGMNVVSKMFPDGTATKIASYTATRDFYIYVVPPVGCDWLRVNAQVNSPNCPDQPAPLQNPPDQGTPK